MTSLDDLLSGAEDARADRSGGAWAAWWLAKAGVAAAALAGGLVLALLLFEVVLPFPLAFAGILALIMLHRAVRTLDVTPPGRLGGRPEPPVHPAGPDGLAVAASRWQGQLSYGGTGPSPRRAAAPVLAELVDARLRDRHGITRDSDPARARALLGEKLWAYLAHPSARTPSPRELATMLTHVEKL